MIKRYRKKPVEIEALQWDGTNREECARFIGEAFGGVASELAPDGTLRLTILTLEGEHIANQGDYIIRGVQGEHYPCKPDIFERTYDPV